MAPGRGENLLKIGELAGLARVLPSTIHYYTKQGLLRFAAETPGGYRLYEKAASIKRLKDIRRLQDKERWTISEIKRKFRQH